MKPDGLVPIPLVLDLWALGHSQSQIAEMAGLPNRRHVERILKHAREIEDPRAVLHHAANGRLIGRPGRAGAKVRKGAHSIKGKEVVPAIKGSFCPKGHERTPENRTKNNSCRICTREATRAWRRKKQ